MKGDQARGLKELEKENKRFKRVEVTIPTTIALQISNHCYQFGATVRFLNTGTAAMSITQYCSTHNQGLAR